MRKAVMAAITVAAPLWAGAAMPGTARADFLPSIQLPGGIPALPGGLPTIPSLPFTLPGLGPAEAPLTSIGMTAIQWRGQLDDYVTGKLPGIELPYVGEVRTMADLQMPLIGLGGQVYDTIAAMANKVGLPLPQRAGYAPIAGMYFANALWSGDKRLMGACTLAGTSCGPMMTRLTQASIENNPLKAEACKVFTGIAGNRNGFGQGFNNAMTKNVQTVAPATAPVTVDFRTPRC